MDIAANESSSVPPAIPAPERARDDGVVVSSAQDGQETSPTGERLATIHKLLGEVMSTAVAPDVLELAMATAISQRVVPHGPPVWLLFEGPPSGGKTTLVNLLKGLEKPDPLAVFVSKFTIGSLTGGFRDEKSKKRSPALLAQFDTRCWVNTEFSALLSGRTEIIKPIIGTLTSAFDGEFLASVDTQNRPVVDT